MARNSSYNRKHSDDLPKRRSSQEFDFDDEEDIPQRRGRTATRKAMQKKKRKKKALWATIITVIVIIAIIAAIITGVFVWISGSWNGRYAPNFGGGGTGMPNEEVLDSPISSQDDIDNANDNLEVSKDGLKQIKDTSDVMNILLVGTDARASGGDMTQAGQNTDMRTDSMMLVSINTKTKKVIMCSLLRDTYVKIKGYSNNKLNAAFFYGGTDLLKDTLKQNLFIDIDYYMAVDFFSFIDIVDTIGGVEMTLTADEIKVANTSYLWEINKITGQPYGTDYIDMSNAGKKITLNGKQALAYSRNRYSHNYDDGTDNDFGRTSRQRAVLNAILDKVKTKSVLELSSLYNKILPYITTNIPSDKLMSMVVNNLFDYAKFEIVQTSLPQEGMYKDLTIASVGDVLSIDFKKNNNYLHDLIYGQ